MPETGTVDVKDLEPCFGLLCCISSMYLECPDCFGSVMENTCLCLNTKIILCKAGKEDNVHCKCNNKNQYISYILMIFYNRLSNGY